MSNSVINFIKYNRWAFSAFVLALIVMSPAIFNDWVNRDDALYVLDNPIVNGSLSKTWWDCFRFQGVNSVTYAPILLLSFKLNYYLFGADPFSFHLINVLLHGINVLAVYFFIKLLVANNNIAGLAALLFAVHPMNTENIAWVSGRKDLLYTLFYLSGLVFYLKAIQVEQSKKIKYLLGSFLFFLLSVLSKGVAITFPFVLLLIDFLKERKITVQKVIEKAPFLALSLIFSVLAWLNQQEGGTLNAISNIPYHESFFVATYGWFIYLLKFFIPYKLAAFHPYPWKIGEEAPWYICASLLPVLLIILILKLRKAPNIIVTGLYFFTITIAPVLQFFPIGNAIIAERYVYLPYIGLLFALSYLIVEFYTAISRLKKRLLTSAVVVIICCYSYSSIGNILNWKNSISLWNNVIRNYPDHPFGYASLASYYMSIGEWEKAVENYDKSIAMDPIFYEGYNNKGYILIQTGAIDEGMNNLKQCIIINPQYPNVYVNLGLGYLRLKKYELAITKFEKAIELGYEDLSVCYFNLGLTYQRLDNLSLALDSYNEAIILNTGVYHYFFERGILHFEVGNLERAIADFDSALALNPAFSKAYFKRSIVNLQLGNQRKAQADARKAIQLGYVVNEEYKRAMNIMQ